MQFLLLRWSLRPVLRGEEERPGFTGTPCG